MALFRKLFQTLLNLKSSMKTQPWNVKLHYDVFYISWNKNFFNENEYDKRYPTGSAPARIYGTPKMHQFSTSNSFPKLRPIVSSIDTFNYNLADLLSCLVPNDYSRKNTFSFVSQIKNTNLSYGVTSLCTNIPLQETIDIAIIIPFSILILI